MAFASGRTPSVQMLAETVAAVGFEQTVKAVVPLLGPLAEVNQAQELYVAR